jgi:hypothetical protein
LIQFFDAPELIWLEPVRITVKTSHSAAGENYNTGFGERRNHRVRQQCQPWLPCHRSKT